MSVLIVAGNYPEPDQVGSSCRDQLVCVRRNKEGIRSGPTLITAAGLAAAAALYWVQPFLVSLRADVPASQVLGLNVCACNSGTPDSSRGVATATSCCVP